MAGSSADSSHFFEMDVDPAIGYNRVYFNLLRVQRSLMARIASELRSQGIGDPMWGEIFVQIDRSGENGIVMWTLEQLLHCPQYSLSRHVSRLEEAGYVETSAADGPGRTKRLILTEKGRAKKVEFEAAMAEIIQTEFESKLSTHEAYDLTRYLIRLYP